MKISPITEIIKFDTYIKECMGEPLAFATEKGKIVAVLLPVRDEEQLEKLLLAHSSEFRHILQTGKQQIKDGKGISQEGFWKETEADGKTEFKTV